MVIKKVEITVVYAIEKSGTHEIHISKAVRRQCQWDKEQRQVAR